MEKVVAGIVLGWAVVLACDLLMGVLFAPDAVDLDLPVDAGFSDEGLE